MICIIVAYLLFNWAVSRVLFPKTDQTENGVEGIILFINRSVIRRDIIW